VCSQRISVKSIPPDRLASSAEPNPAFAEVSRKTERMCPKTKRYGAALAAVPFLPLLSFAAFADGNAPDAFPANT